MNGEIKLNKYNSINFWRVVFTFAIVVFHFAKTYPAMERGHHIEVGWRIGVEFFFIVAGFIESFLTRHQEWPMQARVALMAAGLAISIYYIIVLPRQLNKVASPPALPRRDGAGTRKTNNKE